MFEITVIRRNTPRRCTKFHEHDTAEVRRMDAMRVELEAFESGLPKLKEADLSALGHEDSTCPICLTPFMAVLAEEEMALAMDSPAHAAEELGVTRLVQTCGHVFCRRDIRQWLHLGRRTCPTCRRPFIAGDSSAPEGGTALIEPLGLLSDTDITLEDLLSFIPAENSRNTDLSLAFRRSQREPQSNRNEDGNEFSGMYS
ncbi:hypothetical protein A0H81_11354 [Grifola frondosa]|uniref:RING-type domain-containing protein n=1 Tax=Grifola frondosa TaxID=5627 RepID=A0A1C7LWT4_GRIFR|nr:hypothetical protein A0H81_11354 [Grifola frondosa]